MDVDFLTEYVAGRLPLAQYVAFTLDRSGLDELTRDCEGLRDHLADALLKGLRELDALPRTDTFWAGTNGVPTIYKLGERARAELARSPADPFWAWVSIALELMHGRQHLEATYWRPLLPLDPGRARWLVLTAWNASPYWTDQNVESLGILIRELRVGTECRLYLDELRRSGAPGCVRWVDDVCSVAARAA